MNILPILFGKVARAKDKSIVEGFHRKDAMSHASVVRIKANGLTLTTNQLLQLEVEGQ